MSERKVTKHKSTKKPPADRPPPVKPATLESSIAILQHLRLEAADFILHMIDVLDDIDGDADLEPAVDDEEDPAEPSLGAPEVGHGNQVNWSAGTCQDGEASIDDDPHE